MLLGRHDDWLWGGPLSLLSLFYSSSMNRGLRSVVRLEVPWFVIVMFRSDHSYDIALE